MPQGKPAWQRKKRLQIGFLKASCHGLGSRRGNSISFITKMQAEAPPPIFSGSSPGARWPVTIHGFTFNPAALASLVERKEDFGAGFDGRGNVQQVRPALETPAKS